ncbi:MAG: YegJ family protein [Opitutaceae bacterium]
MKPLPIIILLFIASLVGCDQKPETLVTGGYDQTEMEHAILRAQNEVNEFVQVLENRAADSFSVKAPITDGDDVEHFWIVDISYKDGYFIGTIGNDPGVVKNVEFGQEWKIKKDEISDWMYTRGVMMHGGYTIDPLLPTMSDEEAAELKACLVR